MSLVVKGFPFDHLAVGDNLYTTVCFGVRETNSVDRNGPLDRPWYRPEGEGRNAEGVMRLSTPLREAERLELSDVQPTKRSGIFTMTVESAGEAPLAGSS